jgi:poly(glycerol-phosphate) alpha-glucosyltransferase
MKAYHVTDSLSRLGCGVPPVVLGHAIHQQRLGLEVSVFGIGDPYTEEDLKKYDLESVDVRLFEKSRMLRRLAYAPGLRAALLQEDGRNAIVHLHGIWMHISTATLRWGKAKGGLYLVAPQGSLDEWALRRSRWKKRVAGWLWENENLSRASCLHAVTDQEYKNMRDYGLRNPVCVVPNGIDLKEFEPLPDPALFAEAFPQASGKRILLFLSRLYPKKGIANLLRAWSAVASKTDNWTLVLAGPEFDEARGHKQELISVADQLGVTPSVLFVGPLYGAAKYQAYAAADAFVLPSLSEGFASVVLEAMACRLPVLITRNCYFDEVEETGAGFVTGTGVESLAGGLENLLGLSDGRRTGMGVRGRELVARKYTWEAVAGQMVSVYRWLLNGGTPPSCVILD